MESKDWVTNGRRDSRTASCSSSEVYVSIFFLGAELKILFYHAIKGIGSVNYALQPCMPVCVWHIANGSDTLMSVRSVRYHVVTLRESGNATTFCWINSLSHNIIDSNLSCNAIRHERRIVDRGRVGAEGRKRLEKKKRCQLSSEDGGGGAEEAKNNGKSFVR